MSAKILPFDAPKSGSGKYRSSYENDPDLQSIGKSPRSPRTRGRLSRQNSESDIKPLSRQNSLQGGSSKNRRLVLEDDDSILDHSGANSARASARGPLSSRKHRSGSRKNLGSKSSKKRVVFSVPLVDPRPERMLDNSSTYQGEDSLTDEEFNRLQANDFSDPTTPRRMRRRKRRTDGRWRRYIPFGQYIPTLPSFFGFFG
mmetsp:Transcript_105068/g.206105  ORF Transcript_105068/g.206105 Transcript_105068/m.206105 type:complete len:201 (+) Transcript_105068:144-746(+)